MAAEHRQQRARHLVCTILRCHPRLDDRQIVLLARALGLGRTTALEARRQLAQWQRIRCRARTNARGQLVKVWELAEGQMHLFHTD